MFLYSVLILFSSFFPCSQWQWCNTPHPFAPCNIKPCLLFSFSDLLLSRAQYAFYDTFQGECDLLIVFQHMSHSLAILSFRRVFNCLILSAFMCPLYFKTTQQSTCSVAILRAGEPITRWKYTLLPFHFNRQSVFRIRALSALLQVTIFLGIFLFILARQTCPVAELGICSTFLE